MIAEHLLLISTAFILLSGGSVFFIKRPLLAQRWVSTLFLLGGTLGIFAAVSVLLYGSTEGISFTWSLLGENIKLQIDEISALFLIPTFFIAVVCTIYGSEYWPLHEKLRSRITSPLFSLLTIGIVFVLFSKNGVFFVVAWEIMGLSAFFLIITEHEKKETQKAAWIYFVSAHISTVVLILFFGLAGATINSFTLEQGALSVLAPARINFLFALALIGFGIKAGIFPFHFWLPGAHAAAPSHVSAMLSGVMIKVGIYGIVRTSWLIGTPSLTLGILLLSLGVLSALFGVVYSLRQREIKRFLAYCSIENIGIICIGLGFALIGKALSQSSWVIFGLAGALFHVWGHALSKAVLFLATGSVISQAETGEIDKLGGISKTMPKTSLCFLLGALALSGVLPFSGFVSELFIYLGLFQAFLIAQDFTSSLITLTIFGLALISALAVASFVRVFGLAFLGEPRSRSFFTKKECGRYQLAAMCFLVAPCLFIGILPMTLFSLFDPAISTLIRPLPSSFVSLHEVISLRPLTVLALSIFLLAFAITRFLRKDITTNTVSTWDCGFLRPSSSLQYTATSFSQIIAYAFQWMVPQKKPSLQITGYFPKPTILHEDVPDTILHGVVEPLSTRFASLFTHFRILQRGRLQWYIFYIFITAIILFVLL